MLLSVLILCAIGLIVYGLHRFSRIHVISEWPRVKATIVSANLDILSLENLTRSNDETPLFRPKLKYEYEFQGKTFSNDVLGITDSAFDFHSEREAREFMAPLSIGCYVDLLVNPAAPSVAFVAPGASRMRRNHYVTTIASGVSILIAGAGVWWLMHA